MLEAASTIKSKMPSDSAAASSSDCNEIPYEPAGKSSRVSNEYLQACAGGVYPVVQPPKVDSPNDSDKVENPNDALIEPLVILFRQFLESMSNAPSDHPKKDTATLRKKLFGLTKGLSPSSNDHFDYEQKYPRDRRGEELADDARVWWTYLDEADKYDREKVDGWRETVDVLLIFAGLFSGVITTFVSQASQSLQQDYTQVSASLLFQIAQVQMAHFTGAPITGIPISTLTPTSTFQPSTNAFLVNGLWFTSLAISLSTALIAVLTKQWLYYYMSAVSGSALEKVRVRHFRFRGLELWKVSLIIDLLPILLHLALGVFLIGVIIFLFPLDTRIAWAIVVITGITYTLYFISVILPIRYPECPYTTSLTIYIGSIFYFLSTIIRRLGLILARFLHFKALFRMNIVCSTGDFIRHLFYRVRRAFLAMVKPIRRIFSDPGMPVFAEGAERFLNWKEKNVDEAIREEGVFIDFTALSWLYRISSNSSVRRVVPRGLFSHPVPFYKFMGFRSELEKTLEISEANLTDLCYGLCLDLQRYHGPGNWEHWHLLQSISDIEGSQPNELLEYQNYLRISEDIMHGNHVQVLKDALSDENLKLPLVVWDCLLMEAFKDETLAAQILSSGHINPFDWSSAPLGKSTYNTSIVSFGTQEQYKWIFVYLFGCFCDGVKPDYSLDTRSFEKGYLLLASLYRNLTSDRPIIADEEQRERSLEFLFKNFQSSFQPYKISKPRHMSPQQFLSFYRDIMCVDTFWNKPMTDKSRVFAVACVNKIWSLCMDFATTVRFPTMGCHDLFPIYKWHSQNLSHDFISPTVILFTPQNRENLLTLLSADSNAASHFSLCLKNLRHLEDQWITRKYMCSSLMELFKFVDPTVPSFWILFNPSVLVQAWKLLAFIDRLNQSHFFSILKSKLDLRRLENLHADMSKEAQSEQNKHVEDPDSEFTVRFESNEACQKYLDALDTSLGDLKRIIIITRSKDSEQKSTIVPVQDHDLEASSEKSNENERESSDRVTVHPVKKAFTSVWQRLSVR